MKKFAKKPMGKHSVQINTRLNKHLWSQGIRNIPFRVHVRLASLRNKDEDFMHKLYTLVTHGNVTTFMGLQKENVESKTN
jgi:large subunit ribosomal protein L31e